MIYISETQKPRIEDMGGVWKLYFNETPINVTTEIDPVTNEETEVVGSYKYGLLILPKDSSYSDMVEAIIKTKYPTYGAEIAAINDPAKSQTHADFVAFAKSEVQLALAEGPTPFVPKDIEEEQL